ncbi:MAG: hypothetical protein U9O94_07250 [Nanoarchaeota archaeon]|nr:hypothetical protein [Nanoarchaeota archaeon]
MTRTELYEEIVVAIYTNFSPEDKQYHFREIMEQLYYEITIDNIEWRSE